MKKMKISTLFCFLFLSIIPETVFANGWFTESPYLKSGDLVIDAKLSLQKENVKFFLGENEFKTVVVYELSANVAKYKGFITFPVLCNKNRESDVVENRKCVENFGIKMDGKPIIYEEAKGAELEELNNKYNLRVYSPEIIKQYVNYDSGGVPLEPIDENSFITLYRAAIEPSTKKFTLTIEYTTPYYNVDSGYTKSSFFYFSNDVVYYDFSPMAIWSPNLLSELIIEVHPQDIKGQLVFPRDWAFKKMGFSYLSRLKNIKPSKIKPLIFTVNQKNYRQYKVHMGSITRANLNWYIKSNDTLPDKNNAYSPEMIVDENLKTAWCSKKSQPKFTFKIEPDKSRGGNCYLEGIGFINGYTKSSNLFIANRRIKRGYIKINGDSGQYLTGCCPKSFNDNFLVEEKNIQRLFLLFYHFVYIKLKIGKVNCSFNLNLNPRITLFRVSQLCFLTLGTT